ncbi:MAG: thioredoxin family protein [Ignavibacteriaceae bacterium]|nr:thioredoxin family protein [Ignavibacteriaceae bacterium]
MSELSLSDLMPHFRLPAVDGKTYESGDFAGKPILAVIFSCNHCPYVQAYEERIKDIQARYGAKGVQIIAINPNDSASYPEDSFEEMKKRAEGKQFNFIYLRDETQETARIFGASATPQLYVFNHERRLVYTGKIDDNWREPERVQTRYLEDALNELLDGKEVSVPETYAVGCSIKWKN